MRQYEEVISAVATPPGTGALGVIRLSGNGAAAVLSRIFKPKKKPEEWVSHRMYHGKIYDRGEAIDEVMVTVMRAPRSYTAEDTVEIYAHGGSATVRAVLEATLHHGARPAEPGEFTKRAFLNGRVDLSQAEAVMELIQSKTSAARRAGLRQLGGGLSEKINHFREIILSCLAHIELSIDYPEHESEAMNLQAVSAQCRGLMGDMDKLLATAAVGRIITEGLRVAIVGCPNVGKSSLLNAILREDRAIVTDIPGTTRDVLSELVNIRGVSVRLSDTAGLRDTGDAIEKRGVEKSFEEADRADLVLWTVDRSMPPRPEDYALLERYKNRNLIVLLNKCDLPPANGWRGCFFSDFIEAVEISAKQGTGLEDLYKKIEARFLSGLESGTEMDILTRERHRYLLERAMMHLRSAVEAADGGLAEDLISIDLTSAYRSLGEIVGAEVGEDIVDRIFSEFCVGK